MELDSIATNPTSPEPLSVSYRQVQSLRPDPRNARIHPKRQLDQIVASIREFGFTNPILIDPEGGIIAGHGRLLAAKAIGMTEVPTIALGGLTEAQKRALRLADNKIALGAAWDLELLRAEIGDLSTLDVDLDLSLTGFSTGEIDVILKGAPDPDDEIIPAVRVAPRTQVGDIWILGDHRIGCGDGRDIDFLRAVVAEGAHIDAAFLDPPYNVRIGGHANTRGRHREFAMASGEMAEDEFRAFLSDTLGACTGVSRDGAVHFVCMDWRHMDDLSVVGRKVYGGLLNLYIWNKSNAGMGSLYRSKHELVFVYRVGKSPHFNAVELGRHGRNRTNVWDYPSVNTFGGSRREDPALHPTVKPTGLVADAIRDVTRRGDLVLDIFLGAGTTLIAAERMRSGGSTTQLREVNSSARPVRRIVFQGEADSTVHPSNASMIVAAAVGSDAMPTKISKRTKRGRSYARSHYAGSDGTVHVELWKIAGASHTWSGGKTAGSYTDTKGPDASVELVRFFLAKCA